MRKKILVAMAIAMTAVSSFFVISSRVSADSSPAVALHGQVSSDKEGPMEGVVVGAKKEGSTITVDVFSDEKGNYAFPAARLEPGHYALKIRTAGYDLDGLKAVEIAAGKATN